MLSEEFTIRQATPDDMAMVYSYWIDAHRDQVLDIPRNWYRPLYQKVLQRLLYDFPVTVYVVCLTRIPEQVLAFAAFQPGYLHYVFTKKIYRRHGIATALLDDAMEGEKFRYTMKPSPSGRELLAKYACRPAYRYIQREFKG